MGGALTTLDARQVGRRTPEFATKESCIRLLLFESSCDVVPSSQVYSDSRLNAKKDM